METATQQIVEVTASTPQEMVNSQNDLIAWCGGKITSLVAEKTELESDIARAKSNKWRVKPLVRTVGRLEKSIEFYVKMRTALERGYCIVPNFPCDVFAVRVEGNPEGKPSVWASKFEQSSQSLPEGDGEWRNPFPRIGDTVKNETEGGKEVWKPATYPKKWQEDMDFPISMAKPQIMDLTQVAMQGKFFDELGFSPSKAVLRKKGDPMILGRILMPQFGWAARKIVSFLIAWHIDTRTL